MVATVDPRIPLFRLTLDDVRSELATLAPRVDLWKRLFAIEQRFARWAALGTDDRTRLFDDLLALALDALGARPRTHTRDAQAH